MQSWLPLESNPEVMNKFLVKLGVPPNITVSDVYSMEPDMLVIVPQPVVALLLLFPCDEKYEEHKKKQEVELTQKGVSIPDDLYFLKQYVHNACGTIALIHSIANVDDLKLENGFLNDFLEKSRKLTPEERGEMLQNNGEIINAHKETAEEGQTPANDRDMPYHFIAFVQKNSILYELDGRKAFPIVHGGTNKENFLNDAIEACRQYMARDPDNVNFTILALSME